MSPHRLRDNMSRFHGFRTCTVCSVGCTPSNFVDHEGKRYCTACWIERENPEHEAIEEIREKTHSDAAKWKRQKYSRQEGPHPTGPQPTRND
ncbi:TPA: hypothetical protein HA325_02875 [Candidatus Thalassarchaeaceae archaeon]|nr:hypothetical protein [Candidatus Thalassarchaeaceae archaeon]